MDTTTRLSTLCLSLFALGIISLHALHVETRAAPVSRVESWRNQRYLMQSKANPTRWEALEVLAHDPAQYTRTELSPAQARRWMEAGGFRRVSSQEYNDLLFIADGYRAARARPNPNGARTIRDLEAVSAR